MKAVIFSTKSPTGFVVIEEGDHYDIVARACNKHGEIVSMKGTDHHTDPYDPSIIGSVATSPYTKFQDWIGMVQEWGSAR